MSENSLSLFDLNKTLQLLKKEQEEDRNQYREKVLKNSLTERKNLGVSWYPIVIKEAYYGVGERLTLEIERPGNTDAPHMFQFGSMASLFSNYHNEGAENPSLTGIVTSVRSNNLKLTLSADELPDWANLGKIGLDLLFDESSYKEMEMAMARVIKAEKNRLSELREVLLGAEAAVFSDHSRMVKVASLNESQNKAYQKVCAARDIAIIHGPPGTGKTTTLIECIIKTIESEKQVLVCAPSNTAVDLLTEQLARRGVNVLRMGNPSRVNDALQIHTLDFKVSAHPDFKQIREFRKRANEFRTMGMKYKRNFGKEERDQRKLVFDEAKKLQQEAEKVESYIIEELLKNARVIASTLVGSANYVLRDRKYNTVFIDEAGQALEPACWIAIAKASRVVMAGDHLQLPPTIKSLEAAKGGLNVTLMEKAMRKEGIAEMLQIQYRMNERIMHFSNVKFYEGNLKAHESVRDITLLLETGNSEPLEFIDTAGCGYQEKYMAENQSLSNEEEANLLLKRLRHLMEETEGTNNSIGIIAPYKAQISLLKEKVAEAEDLTPYNISINTVDGFQGQEKDIICISLVRSNDKGEIGFLSDTRRMNVAMTRARKKLIIIGDSSTLARHAFYNDLVAFAETVGAYKSAWEFIY